MISCSETNTSSPFVCHVTEYIKAVMLALCSYAGQFIWHWRRHRWKKQSGVEVSDEFQQWATSASVCVFIKSKSGCSCGWISGLTGWNWFFTGWIDRFFNNGSRATAQISTPIFTLISSNLLQWPWRQHCHFIDVCRGERRCFSSLMLVWVVCSWWWIRSKFIVRKLLQKYVFRVFQIVLTKLTSYIHWQLLIDANMWLAAI